jgi:hypothetical protein
MMTSLKLWLERNLRDDSNRRHWLSECADAGLAWRPTLGLAGEQRRQVGFRDGTVQDVDPGGDENLWHAVDDASAKKLINAVCSYKKPKS